MSWFCKVLRPNILYILVQFTMVYVLSCRMYHLIFCIQY